NGSANAVKFSVVSTNAIGNSDPVNSGTAVWSDIIPPAPAALSASPLDHGLRISWNSVTTPAGGTPVTSYIVAAGGIAVTVSCGTSVCTRDIVDPSLTNGSPVTYSVSARNDAYGPLAAWNSTSQQGTPAGPPIAVAAPAATATSDRSISLDWTSTFSDNGKAISAYTAALYTGAVPTCAANGSVNPRGATIVNAGTGTSTLFGGLSPEVEYTLLVFAYNGQGCTASQSVVARTPPPVITALGLSGPVQNGAVFDFVLTGVDFGSGMNGSGYSVYYRLNGGTEYGPVPIGGFLQAEPLQYGQVVSVQARACRDYSGQLVCQGIQSASFALGVPVNPQVTGPLTYTPDGTLPAWNSGTFAWLGFPTGSYELVEFACGIAPGGTFVTAGSTMNCHVDASPGQTPYLTIRVTANGGQTYTITYNGFDYD
ncbi:MAG: hypothetical protein Q8M65_08015, partial [Rhodoglobus sp.]|nr:hypothetical protein [Rhodoglobus sp.]